LARCDRTSPNEALLIDDRWLLPTIACERPAGCDLFGASWKAAVAQYNVLRGEMWDQGARDVFVPPLPARSDIITSAVAASFLPR